MLTYFADFPPFWIYTSKAAYGVCTDVTWSHWNLGWFLLKKCFCFYFNLNGVMKCPWSEDPFAALWMKQRNKYMKISWGLSPANRASNVTPKSTSRQNIRASSKGSMNRINSPDCNTGRIKQQQMLSKVSTGKIRLRSERVCECALNREFDENRCGDNQFRYVVMGKINTRVMVPSGGEWEEPPRPDAWQMEVYLLVCIKSFLIY